MPKISLCMIVRDEAELLPGCLESAVGAVDEIVVLDTGSTDNTRSIAGDFGALVIPAAWTDFSTARNQVLRRASGDWVLVLDADEELLPETPDRLRELALADEADAYALRVINSVELSEFIDVEKSPKFHMVRFFKREGALYMNPIHEKIRFPGGTRTAPASGIDIIHYGFMPEIFEKKNKAARNRALLARWVEDESSDPWAHFFLAQEDQHDGVFADAAESYKVALELFINNDDGNAAVDTYISLAECLQSDGQTAEAGKKLAQGVLAIPDSAKLRLTYGDFLLETDNPEAAAEQFGECLSLNMESGGGSGPAIVWERLALALERAGQADQAQLARAAARQVSGQSSSGPATEPAEARALLDDLFAPEADEKE